MAEEAFDLKSATDFEIIVSIRTNFENPTSTHLYSRTAAARYPALSQRITSCQSCNTIGLLIAKQLCAACNRFSADIRKRTDELNVELTIVRPTAVKTIIHSLLRQVPVPWLKIRN